MPAHECVAPNEQENLLNETNPHDGPHRDKSGATHPPHTDTLAEIQNTLRDRDECLIERIEIVAY